MLAEGVDDPDRIRALLVQQVTGAVRWRESVQRMAADGIDTIWEVGAGKALSGMIRRIHRDAGVRTVGTPDEVRDAAASAA